MNRLTLLLAIVLISTSAFAAVTTRYPALQTYDATDTYQDLDRGDIQCGEDLTVDDDITVGYDATVGGDIAVTGTVSGADGSFSDDLTVTDDGSFAQITSGVPVIMPFYMDSPASPETVTMPAIADGEIIRVDHVLRTGTATVVLRNDTDGVNLATLSMTSTATTTATITSAEDVDAEDNLKLTVTADSSAAEGIVWVTLLTSSAASPEQ